MKSLIRNAIMIVTISSLGLMVIAVPSTVFPQAQSSPADWTQFHRDNMQRWNPYETVLGVGNVGQLKLKWQFPISVSLPSPAVVNGVVYLGSNTGVVYAWNASTGALLWNFPQVSASGVQCSPAVANGVVYVGLGGLYALNASTGALLWSYPLPTGVGVEGSPTVVNGVVYFGVVDGNRSYYVLNGVYALNASTGALLWSYMTNGSVVYPPPGFVYSSPAVANGVVYFGSANYNVYALNASTGALRWSYPTGYFVLDSPAVANGVVYIGSEDGNVYALNASTGALLWRYATEGGIDSSSPAVANGVVYIGSANDVGDSYLYALNASTGAKLWSYNTGDKVESSPAVANGVVYVGSRGRGNVNALNASTGALLWNYATGSVADSSPAVVNGTLYIGSSAFSLGADLFLRIIPTPTTVHQGDLLTYAFPVWNLGPNNAVLEVLNTQVPAGTVFDYVRISGTPGLGTCTTPPYQGTGKIICHENGAMAPNTTWTVRVTVKVTAPAGTVITENAATLADSPDPNMANNTATVSTTVQ